MASPNLLKWFRKPMSWKFWLVVSFGLTAAMLYFFYIYPQQRLGPEQPIPFSHRVHAGVKQINCRFCHPYVERSKQAGIPSMTKCFYCHKYIIPLHPQLVKEKRYLEQKEPVPWIRIFYIPDHVKFRHQPHIELAKLDCSECHGQVQAMDRLYPVEFKMKFCIDCHKKRKAPLDCWLGCHR